MRFFQKLKSKIQQFMTGRYGGDELSRAISVAALVLIVVQFVFSLFGLTVVTTVLWVLVWALLIWSLYRSFSKQISKRYAENVKYLYLKNKFKSFVKLQKDRWKDRKTHVYRRCPKCRCVLRLPRKKGQNPVKCPKCGERFSVRCFF